MAKRIVASYCTTFLKPEMLHIYRQVTSLRRSQTFVMTKKVEHPRRFRFDDIERIPRPHRNLLRHGWMKFVERRPPLIYRGEYQMLVSILGRRGADMMHIYFGHTGVHLLPFIRAWNKPGAPRSSRHSICSADWAASHLRCCSFVAADWWAHGATHSGCC